MRKMFVAAVAAMLASASVHAQSTTLLTAGASAQLTLPSSISFDFVGGAGAASLNFLVRGYNTLDGQGAFAGGTDYSDLFTLTLNGTTVYSGYFVLGGIGSQNILVQDPAATTAPVNNGLNAGGSLTVATPLTLTEGMNRLTFGYSTGNPQSRADESWSLDSITLVGNAAGSAAVPEPMTWAMMALGFGVAGAALRRRAATTAHVSA